jgi:hypothetical protein
MKFVWFVYDHLFRVYFRVMVRALFGHDIYFHEGSRRNICVLYNYHMKNVYFLEHLANLCARYLQDFTSLLRSKICEQVHCTLYQATSSLKSSTYMYL